MAAGGGATGRDRSHSPALSGHHGPSAAFRRRAGNFFPVVPLCLRSPGHGGTGCSRSQRALPSTAMMGAFLMAARPPHHGAAASPCPAQILFGRAGAEGPGPPFRSAGLGPGPGAAGGAAVPLCSISSADWSYRAPRSSSRHECPGLPPALRPRSRQDADPSSPAAAPRPPAAPHPQSEPKGSGGSSYGSGSAAIQPKGGLFQGGVPKLRPVGAKDSSDSSTKQTLQVPGSRAAAPRPPVPASNSRPQDDADSSRGSPPELPRTQRPSLPDLSRPGTAGGTGMKHSSSAPPPPPPGRRAAAPPAPPPAHAKASPYNREKPLPPTPGQRLPGSRDGPPAPPPIKPPPSPVSLRSGTQSLAPPPPPYRQPPGVPNGPSSPSSESAPELPQRHNSLHRKAPGPLRGLAPPPPTAASPSLQSSRPPPPARDPPSRGAAPPPPPPMLRNGGRDAPPPPPPYRLHGPAEPPSRGKPPPPPTRTPAGPPPPPPPVRNGHRDSISTVRAFLDDFESKYSFHPVEDFPAPEEYKYFQRIYPSKTNRATRGAPPLPPIPR
ncbi:WAS/WASL-interacting protein family member 2 isoform X1 [Onychostruthus taczanowskii]|uniref:WAS/WASL-interacting protein family member 2 isoform X1 n=1 Tax=Onychostruthus taczanowskii TaxID=356909 RepID=UPI001B8065E7|nr:WAS/WASL-interacting protein family member 2 isoform X1 [Onychostruthus taczanowskii]